MPDAAFTFSEVRINPQLTSGFLADTVRSCARSTSQRAAALLCGIVVPTVIQLRNDLLTTAARWRFHKGDHASSD